MGLGMMIAERHLNDKAWQRKRKLRALRKKENNRQNRAIRAALYAEYALMGNNRHQGEAPRWHNTLTAISKGTIPHK